MFLQGEYLGPLNCNNVVLVDSLAKIAGIAMLRS